MIAIDKTMHHMNSLDERVELVAMQVAYGMKMTCHSCNVTLPPLPCARFLKLIRSSVRVRVRVITVRVRVRVVLK